MTNLEKRIAALEATGSLHVPDIRIEKAVEAFFTAIRHQNPSANTKLDELTTQFANRMQTETLTNDDLRILAAIPEYPGGSAEDLVLLLHQVASSV